MMKSRETLADYEKGQRDGFFPGMAAGAFVVGTALLFASAGTKEDTVRDMLPDCPEQYEPGSLKLISMSEVPRAIANGGACNVDRAIFADLSE